MQINIENCPVCDHSELDIFLKSQDYFLTHEPFYIKRCKHCNFLFTSPRPTEQILPSYYKSEEYISHSNKNEGLISRIYQLVRQYTLAKKVSLIQKYSTKGKLLDIGCGTGEFLHKANQIGFLTTGVEPNENARSFGRGKYNLEVFDENQLHEFAENSFDIITLWHVLEHVPDLNGRINQIKNLLTQEGLLVIALPNPLSFDARYYNDKWAAWDLPRHLYHFKPSDVSRLFQKYDMEIVKILPMFFDSFYVSLLSEKYKSGKDKYIWPFLVGLWSNFSALNASKNYSSQIYVIRHKNA